MKGHFCREQGRVFFEAIVGRDGVGKGEGGLEDGWLPILMGASVGNVSGKVG